MHLVPVAVSNPTGKLDFSVRPHRESRGRPDLDLLRAGLCHTRGQAGGGRCERQCLASYDADADGNGIAATRRVVALDKATGPFRWRQPDVTALAPLVSAQASLSVMGTR